MASVQDLSSSLQDALDRANDVSRAVTQSVTASASRMKATGVSIMTTATDSGVQVRFGVNPRSRAQVRMEPASVAERAEQRLTQTASNAVREVMGRD